MEKFKKSLQRVYGEDGNEKHFIFIHLFSSIVRTGITLTPIILYLKCVAGASRIRMQAKSLGPQIAQGNWLKLAISHRLIPPFFFGGGGLFTS